MLKKFVVISMLLAQSGFMFAGVETRSQMLNEVVESVTNCTYLGEYTSGRVMSVGTVNVCRLQRFWLEDHPFLKDSKIVEGTITEKWVRETIVINGFYSISATQFRPNDEDRGRAMSQCIAQMASFEHRISQVTSPCGK